MLELCLLENKLAKLNDKIYKEIPAFVPGNYYACQLWGHVAKTVKEQQLQLKMRKIWSTLNVDIPYNNIHEEWIAEIDFIFEEEKSGSACPIYRKTEKL